MNLNVRKTCRFCGSNKLTKVINLGKQYLQGYFVEDNYNKKKNIFNTRFLTELVRCDPKKNKNACGLLQMSISIPPKLLYSQYFYKSGINSSMKEHLKRITIEIKNIFKKKKKVYVLDIGCNDGTLLNFYPKKYIKFGIDPSDSLSNGNKNFNFIKDFFPSIRLEKFLKQRKLDVITSIAMFYDLEDPSSFVKNIYKLLEKKGIWIFEMSYMLDMLRLNSYDTICHEHLEYYSFSVIEKILTKNKMKIAKVRLNNSNGGSIRCYAVKECNFVFGTLKDRKEIENLRKKETNEGLHQDKIYKDFQKKVIQHRKELRNLIVKLKKQGKKIHIYGASTKGNTILQWCRINHKLVDFASERNSQKHGLKTLGTNIPIVSEKKSRSMKPDYYLALPWHFRNEFIKREQSFLKKGGCFIFPLPKIEIYKY
jgi:SAM-dependent methyltransferase